MARGTDVLGRDGGGGGGGGGGGRRGEGVKRVGGMAGAKRGREEEREGGAVSGSGLVCGFRAERMPPWRC